MDAVITPFRTSRLQMLPLQVEHAGEMAEVLSDPALYGFTGGEPPTVESLEVRYRRQLAGPAREDEHWLNWVVQHDDELIGFVQATIIDDTAEIAWVIGTDWQGNGYAKEAAQGLVAWLGGHDLRRMIAHIHPEHLSSMAVARAVGLTRTDEVDDGEYLWTT